MCEAQIELTVGKKTLLEDIIERPSLKAGPGDVAHEYWVYSLLNLLCCLLCFVYCLIVYVFCNLVDPLHKIT